MTQIIFGIHSLNALLATNPKRIVALHYIDKNNPKYLAVIKQCHKQQITFTKSTQQQLDKLSNQARHQGLVATIKDEKNDGEAELKLFLSQINTPALILVLESLYDPRNFGACLRCAVASGVNCIIFKKRNNAPLSPLVHHASAGMSFYAQLFAVNNLSRSLDLLKQHNIWCYGLEVSAKKNIYQTDFNSSSAIIIGSEDKGLRQLTKNQCDLLISIPMQRQTQSLNLASAAAVSLFEVRRQMRITG